ncbi:2-nonaprenyl-3-methyl-6-methoxy-1 benzoquinol hydroxylase [Salix suchowensis]|nr:2-nonaprenyl-3-methyl-6-methoxy-1 benzoquinol hydroxylase [Salix suchowensis]KAG5233481.1 2-nonaprenyl-3-methyl-6-methoxy-1 benzoquinol hydroxylase [Salix suchowensis]
MSTKRKAWIVAACIEAVEELKDQGFCRCTSTLISLHQHAMNNLRSILQATKLSSSSSAMVSGKLRKSSQYEKSLSKAMYLGCWGPY